MPRSTQLDDRLPLMSKRYDSLSLIAPPLPNAARAVPSVPPPICSSLRIGVRVGFFGTMLTTPPIAPSP